MFPSPSSSAAVIAAKDAPGDISSPKPAHARAELTKSTASEPKANGGNVLLADLAAMRKARALPPSPPQRLDPALTAAVVAQPGPAPKKSSGKKGGKVDKPVSGAGVSPVARGGEKRVWFTCR